MNKLTKTILCILELMFICCFCIYVPLFLFVLNEMNLVIAFVFMFGAGILGGDLVIRAVDGEGFVW